MSQGTAEGASFREAQQFRQVWIWLLVAVASIGPWVVVAIAGIQYFFPQLAPADPSRGELGASFLIAIIVWILFGIGLPLFMYSIKLEVEVRSDGIHIRYFPFLTRIISWAEVNGYELRRYRAFWEFGGRGIRWSSGSGWAYIVDGDRGIQLDLASGKRLLIGSQRPEEFLQAVRRAQGGKDRG